MLITLTIDQKIPKLFQDHFQITCNEQKTYSKTDAAKKWFMEGAVSMKRPIKIQTYTKQILQSLFEKEKKQNFEYW